MPTPPISPLRGLLRQAVREHSRAAAQEPVASIVMLTLNQSPMTRMCLESLFAHTTVPFELIMVDNGSTDDTRDYLRALAAVDDRVRLVFNRSNTGFAGGCNQGLELARGEVVVLLNNDTVLTPGWLEGLIQPMLLDAAVGAVGPRTNNCPPPQVLPEVPYARDMAAMQTFARSRRQAYAGQGQFMARLIGFCVAVRTSVLKQIGGLDTRFGIGNFEDDDLCLRIRTAGYKVWLAEDVFVHHWGSQTFKAQKVDYTHLMGENWKKFSRKWGMNMPFSGSYPGEALARLPFDPARDIFPLLGPEGPVAPIEGATGFRFLMLPDWRQIDRVIAAIATFNAAFRSTDPVSLLLWVDPAGPLTTEDVAQALGARLAEAGLDGEGTPELVLFDAPGDAIAIGSVYRTSHACLTLGDAGVAEAARACGLQALDTISPEGLRAAVR